MAGAYGAARPLSSPVNLQSASAGSVQVTMTLSAPVQQLSLPWTFLERSEKDLHRSSLRGSLLLTPWWASTSEESWVLKSDLSASQGSSPKQNGDSFVQYSLSSPLNHLCKFQCPVGEYIDLNLFDFIRRQSSQVSECLTGSISSSRALGSQRGRNLVERRAKWS